jgi:protease I
MKRVTIAIIILAGFPAICAGQYASQAKPLKMVQLSTPRVTGEVSFEQALAQRRSVRQFVNRPLDFTQIGQLAWAGQGITDKQKGFRTAPSAGALYPMNLYFATADGIFVYQPEEHSLEQLFNQDIRDKLAQAALGQQHVAKAACDIIVAGSAKKLAVKYGNKARRFMLLEAGHIAQNILLQAGCLGLGAVPVGAFDINLVRNVGGLPMSLEPIYIICVGYPAEQAKEERQEKQMDSAKAKKAVLIIASENFRDEELFETKKALDEASVRTVIASTRTGTIKGMLGGEAEASILVSDLKVDDYDAVVFIGGSGAKEYFDSKVAWNIVRRAAEKKKVLAAICIAPSVLANAGLLDGVRATSFASERTRLQKAGAKYTGADVERDGLIITASGPKAAKEFGKAISEALRNRQ